MNLGIVQWVNGSTIHMLAERNVWSALSAITLMGCVFVGSLVELDLTILKNNGILRVKMPTHIYIYIQIYISQQN